MPHQLMSPRGVNVASFVCPVNVNLTAGTNFANGKNIGDQKFIKI